MNKTLRRIGASVGLAAITGLSLALPASAATVAEWGVWLSDEGGDVVSFSNPSMPDATYSVSNYRGWDIFSPASEGEGFSAGSPVGSLIGANATSTSNLFLKVETYANNLDAAVVFITFDSAVPANNLVLALSDVDTDHAVVEMEDANGDSLTGAEIIGTATDTGFNFENLASTNRPTVVAGATSVTIGDAPDATNGSTGWVRPSEAVKSITVSVNTEDNNFNAERIWIGQIGEAPDEEARNENLANTGAQDSMYLVAFAGAAIIAAAGIARRRTK